MLGFLTFVKVNVGSTHDAFAQKVGGHGLHPPSSSGGSAGFLHEASPHAEVRRLRVRLRRDPLSLLSRLLVPGVSRLFSGVSLTGQSDVFPGRDKGAPLQSHFVRLRFCVWLPRHHSVPERSDVFPDRDIGAPRLSDSVCLRFRVWVPRDGVVPGQSDVSLPNCDYVQHRVQLCEGVPCHFAQRFGTHVVSLLFSMLVGFLFLKGCFLRVRLLVILRGGG